MASTVLYPPNIDPILPAFVGAADGGKCRVYFSLSKYSSTLESIKSIHIYIVKQSNGMNVIKKVDDAAAGRFRASGILIINTGLKPVPAKENLYYVDILSSDIEAGDDNGWQMGWIYKIQLRLSTVAYDGSLGQAQWLNVQASNFSEWSTFATTKAIAKPVISVPLFNNFNSNNSVENMYELAISTLDFYGTYQNKDLTENLYSYEIALYKGGSRVEESGTRYGESFDAQNTFSYNFKTELKENEDYKLLFTYETNNKYTESIEFNFRVKQEANTTNISVVTLDNDTPINSTLGYECDEGCVGIKFKYNGSTTGSKKSFYLKRASSKDNFNTWTDIQLFEVSDTSIDKMDIFYDRTIESGIFYQYGVQEVLSESRRSLINKNSVCNIRETEYSYLIGEGGKTLKLTYDAGVSSFTTVKADVKTNTIGSKYPYLFRGGVSYKEFPLNGLISFTMDDNNTFMSDEDYYTSQDIKEMYEDYYKKNNISIYNYSKEFSFREKVLEFLQDGKPKLFKSSTEGNIIVVLTNVSLAPIQSVNRMIANFSATATEIDDYTYDNLIKHKIVKVNKYVGAAPEVVEENISDVFTLYNGQDLIEAIRVEHCIDSNYDIIISNIENIEINFSSASTVNNYAFLYNNKKIITDSYFAFDPAFSMNGQDSLLILDPITEDGSIVEVTAQVKCNFTLVKTSTTESPRTVYYQYGVGRIELNLTANTDIFNNIAAKYRYHSEMKDTTLQYFSVIDGLDLSMCSPTVPESGEITELKYNGSDRAAIIDYSYCLKTEEESI